MFTKKASFSNASSSFRLSTFRHGSRFNDKRERAGKITSQQMISCDQILPPNSPSQPHASTDQLPSAAELELGQEVNRLKLTSGNEELLPKKDYQNLQHYNFIDSGHIAPAFVSPQPRRRPPQQIQQSQLSVPSASRSSFKQGLAPHLWLMKPKERVEFKRSGQVQSR